MEAVLRYLDSVGIDNESVRKLLNIPDSNVFAASPGREYLL